MNLQIEKLVYGGDGLSRAEGQVVLTPFVAAGETVAVELEPVRAGVRRARLEQVLQPAAARVAARCPYFGRCGGCHYQHLDYATQLQAKREILAETLRRTGHIEAPAEIGVISGEPYGYRNRVQLHVEDGRIGYREARSHRLCAIEQCPISSPRINECIAVLNRMVKERPWPRFVESIELFTDESGVQLNVLESAQPVAKRFFEWCAAELPGFVEGPLDYRAGSYQYRVSGGSFFQVNRFLLEPMIAAVTAGHSGIRALDLYAGVGLFSVPLAERFASVTAVESGTTATRDLRFNAERAGAMVETETAAVEDYLRDAGEIPDFVVADPPRTGLGKRVVERLLHLRPARLHLVSCDPATLARDLAQFQGAYQLEELTLLDLFPQTFHIETLAKLVVS